MTTRPDTGGPAFPRPCSEDRKNGDQPDGNSTLDEQDGMTLRDYFAAKAMQALLQNPASSQAISWDVQNGGRAGLPSQKSFDDEIAKSAYEFADAMLKARAAK